MGRLRKSRETVSHKEIGAIWRGVGFILIVVLSVGGYILADVALKSSLLAQLIPQAAGIGGPLPITINKALPPLPGDILMRLAIMLFLDVVAYSVIVTIWAIVNPLKPDKPEDPWSSQGRQ